MINFKACAIIAGIAFILSLIIGIISGNSFFTVIFRALLFATVFFALGILGFFIISQFLPELFSDGLDEFGVPSPGSHLDISVDGPLVGAFPQDDSDDVDDISGKPSAISRKEAHGPMDGQVDNPSGGPLDQSDNIGYNTERHTDDLGFLENMNTQGGMEGDALPDMDSFSGGDSGGFGAIEEVELEPFPAEPRKSSSKNVPVGGDFEPQQLAKAIQTVLKRDEKG